MKLHPLLAHDAAALWLPDVCQVRNPRLLQALMKAVELRGGVIVEACRSHRWNMAGGRVQSVSTSRGEEYAAANYVVTAGAWSGRLLHRTSAKARYLAGARPDPAFQAQIPVSSMYRVEGTGKFLFDSPSGWAHSCRQYAGGCRVRQAPYRRGPGDATSKGARASAGIDRRRPCRALGGIASGIAR